MPYSNFLTENRAPVVLDTSAIINLYASRIGDRIIDVIPNEIIVSEIALDELRSETMEAKEEREFTREMVEKEKVSSVAMNEQEYRMFGKLASGRHSLGDGESATIAIGACRHYMTIIDERKGRLAALKHLSSDQIGWSLDLFWHPRVVALLGKTEATDALYFALRDGRMRIHEEHCDHVVRLIGVRRAIECRSLPGYKFRRVEWEKSMVTETKESELE